MKFIINGGRPLSGTITVNGFKNSATPVIAATILVKGKCVLENIPRIGDVLTILEILKSCGSKVQWKEAHVLEIDNSNLNPETINQDLVGQIRSSILLAGPMLARFGHFRFALPGGCRIGSRSIDTHLDAFRQLGAEINLDAKNGLYEINFKKQNKDTVYLKEFSVTATENLLMLGSRYPVSIRLAACEPHITDLGEFLSMIGVKIQGLGSHWLTAGPGAPSLGNFNYKIINDPIEAGTLAILAVATKSNIKIIGARADHLEAVLEKLKDFGVAMEINPDFLLVNGKQSSLKAAPVQTLPYPGLPTDLQAPFGVLATQAAGRTLIFDTMYQDRLRYIQELKKMGANAEILDAHRAVISGPTALNGSEIESLDLRAGATLVIAALIAQGKSIVGNIEQIDRGYENLDGRLRELGADICRVESS